MVRIRGIARAVAAALLLLGLASCSYGVRVRAAFVNGHLGFVLAEGEPSQGSRCLFRLILSNDAGETVWEIQRPESRLDGCEPWLPLVYGSAPPGMRTLVSAQRLRTDVVYALRGDAAGYLEGAFVLHRAGTRLSVENLDLSSDRAANAASAADNWQNEQSRRTFENAHLPQNEIVEGPFEDRPLPAEQH